MSTAEPGSATTLHTRAILFDGLIVSKWSPRIFDEMGLGGLTAANCTCSVWENFQQTMANIAQWKRWFRPPARAIRTRVELCISRYDVSALLRALTFRGSFQRSARCCFRR